MLIVFEAHMLIVLKCVRVLYYAVVKCASSKKIRLRWRSATLYVYIVAMYSSRVHVASLPHMFLSECARPVPCWLNACASVYGRCLDFEIIRRMLIVFEVHMLIVLKCAREFYYGMCFFPRKNFNNFFLFIFENLITLASLSNEEKWSH